MTPLGKHNEVTWSATGYLQIKPWYKALGEFPKALYGTTGGTYVQLFTRFLSFSQGDVQDQLDL